MVAALRAGTALKARAKVDTSSLVSSWSGAAIDVLEWKS